MESQLLFMFSLLLLFSLASALIVQQNRSPVVSSGGRQRRRLKREQGREQGGRGQQDGVIVYSSAESQEELESESKVNLKNLNSCWQDIFDADCSTSSSTTTMDSSFSSAQFSASDWVNNELSLCAEGQGLLLDEDSSYCDFSEDEDTRTQTHTQQLVVPGIRRRAAPSSIIPPVVDIMNVMEYLNIRRVNELC